MFDNKDNTEYTDDLIKAGQEPIIIKQKDSSDKKFIYTILILLVVLFIIALAVIGYLGSKFFSSNNAPINGAPMTQQQQHTGTTTATQSVSLRANSEPKVEKVVERVDVKQESKNINRVAKVSSSKVANNSVGEDVDIAELESIVNESESAQKKEPVKKVEASAQTKQTTANSGVQQAIGAAATATGTKKLTQEEMAKIAKLVAIELAKAQKAQQQQNQQNQQKSVASAPATSEESLVKSLQEADTDTLQAQKVDLNAKVDTNKVKAGSNKKVDTFNKVVVEKTNNTDDEFAKLSSEIDSILAQDEVKQNKANQEITSQLQDVVKDRQKELRFIVVKPGDTLSSLAYRAYGRASAYVKIYKANPDLVKNPNRIYVGMKLRVPVDEEYKGNE